MWLLAARAPIPVAGAICHGKVDYQESGQPGKGQ